MKKLVSVLLCVILLLSLGSCTKKEQNIQTLSSAAEVSELLNISFLVPATAKYTTFTITDNELAQAHFTFNGFVFDMYASKVLSGKNLCSVKADYAGALSLEFDERASLTASSYTDGSRSCEWTKDGTNYFLYCHKSASDDVFLEICDVIIK